MVSSEPRADCDGSPSARAADFLAALTHPGRPVLTEPVLLVVAHPDDETLACGALLSRLADLTIVHVTDGAPESGEDARRHGFPTPEAYAAARREELGEALRRAEAREPRLFELYVTDQKAAFAMADIARRVIGWMDTAAVTLTHACEGGHPDHDAVAVAVALAAALLAEQGRPPVVVEMPFYRAGQDGAWERQSFPPGGPEAVVLRLTDGERARKQAALAAYRSQAETLAAFGAADEPYRLAPALDLERAPNGGDLLYERYPWGMTGERFRTLAREAATELGVPLQ